MGGGNWSHVAYANISNTNLSNHGTTMPYNAAMASAPPSAHKAHEDLDPKRTNKAGANAGKITREALDSDEHPESLPIAIIFDVTGSMKMIPQVLQSKLPDLFGLLMRKGYVDHPQILFGAIGDAYTDRVPLQISQFESDNRMDEHLSHMFLEGGGGGQNSESYELAAYFLARHTDLDSVNKRGKRGYCFFIGDEHAYAQVNRGHVHGLIGDDLDESLSTESIFAELQEKFDTYYLLATQGSYTKEETIERDGTGISWRKLLNQNAMVLDNASAVCEVIALTIGLGEGRVAGHDEAMEHLKDVGASSAVVAAAGRALATVGAAGGRGGSSVIPVADDVFGSGSDAGEDRL